MNITNKDAVDCVNEMIKQEINKELNKPVKWMRQDIREIYFKSKTALKMADKYLKSLGYKTQMFSYRYSNSYSISYSLNYPLNENN